GTPPTLHSNAYNLRASLVGVTGKYDYAIAGHTWNASSSTDIKNDSTYAARLKEFSNDLKNLTLKGMSGLAMVQTTDVENEVNGLMTYDRKVYKFATSDSVAGKVLKENTEFLKNKIGRPILKTGGQGGELWKYKKGDNGAVEVPADWHTNPNANETGWDEGLGGFGDRSDYHTAWGGDNKEIYLRKKVFIPSQEECGDLTFSMFFDDNYDFFINGVLASSDYTHWADEYRTIEISPAAKSAIIYGGDNLFAIHVIQNTGGAYMDLGVTASKYSYPIDCNDCGIEQIDSTWIPIRTAEDWQNINNNLDGFYRLENDIDLNTLLGVYVPIAYDGGALRGYIDGNNKTLTAPEITGTGDRTGLIRYADGAHITDLRIIDAEVKNGGGDAGILLGVGKGVTIERVVFDEGYYPTKVTGRDHVGVIAGKLEAGKLSVIKDCYVVNATVVSDEYQAAGLVGIINDTRIINSYFTGTVAITHPDRLISDNRDAGGIAARTEGGKNYFTGVMSLASAVLSGSGNEFIPYNGGGYIIIDSATCFTRNDMTLDPIFNATRGGQYIRATESMKRPLADFKSQTLYENAGWDFTNVWAIPQGGGFPVFKYIITDVPVAKKQQNNLKAYSVNSNIVITTEQETAIWIYDVMGKLAVRTDINGTQQITLPLGVYIIKSAQNGNVSAVKVINRR
ncbi:MAG: T9SS type A sorting domain-containing protein, partial [Paludibacter sp.]|nr:T9SS type A sorting domain-containing protein [Paludibacter sp.]